LLLLVACSDQLAVPTEPLRLLRSTWGPAYLGEAFDGSLRPTGGLRPYRFSLADGSLPPGLTLDGGRILGTPTALGTFAFTLEVRDGNLSQALGREQIEVRPLPTPVLRLDAPATELRAPITLRLKVEDARGWRGAQMALTFDATQFALAADPAAIANRVAVLWKLEEGVLLIDAVSLVGAINGALDLVTLRFEPIAPPARLSVTLEGRSRYAGGTHEAIRLEGARIDASAAPSDAAATPSDTSPSDAGGDR